MKLLSGRCSEISMRLDLVRPSEPQFPLASLSGRSRSSNRGWRGECASTPTLLRAHLQPFPQSLVFPPHCAVRTRHSSHTATANGCNSQSANLESWGGGAWHIWGGACTTPPRQRLVTRQLALCSAHAHRGASDVSEGVDGGSPYTAQDHLCSLKCSGPVCFSPPGQPRLDLEHPLMTYTELVSLHVWGHPPL